MQFYRLTADKFLDYAAEWTGDTEVVTAEADQSIDAKSPLNALKGHIADWRLPDQIIRIVAVPLAATGQIDKTRLRADYVSGKVATEDAGH